MFKIRKHTAVENLVSIIIGLLLALVLTWVIAWVQLYKIESSWVYPQVEFVDFKDYNVTKAEHISHPPVKEMHEVYRYSGYPLNAKHGVCYGPSGKETWYNLPMDKVIETMRNKGYSEADYPYMEREDGAKCLGDYVIVAASLEKYRRGNIIQTSLGQGIVCDTGTFAETNPDQIDIAVNW